MHSYGILRSLEWYFETDVSGKPTPYIFKGQALQEDCLTLEDETDKLSRNVGKKLIFYKA